MSLRVVKLGGSLASSAQLPRWLEVIATAGAGKVVLVPGGGPWSDEVRATQQREGMDDRLAHRKALRAMEHYGSLFTAMQANLVPAASFAQMRATLSKSQVPVWLPHDLVVADACIPESWEVTSDSLAAWLANHLNASALLLVKSVNIAEPDLSMEKLGRRGWVDQAFATFTCAARYRIRVLGQGDQEIARRLLMIGELAQNRT